MAYSNVTLTTHTHGSVIPTSWTNTNYTLAQSTGTYQYPSVNITKDGIEMDKSADLIIGGRSIKKLLEAIETRLVMLEPNIALESEWAELKRLGDEYRALEKEIQEKMKTWDILKK